ncbi:MAG: Tm-1-like ATP-binding domain-containing protein [Deltaproteobacteria bacterium]|nr:Tm-1-like ATP-binding domain-containing protein [Deltaproteobacteria bacterium]
MISEAFIRRLKGDLDPLIEVREVDLHINDPSFATVASNLMDQML